MQRTMAANNASTAAELQSKFTTAASLNIATGSGGGGAGSMMTVIPVLDARLVQLRFSFLHLSKKQNDVNVLPAAILAVADTCFLGGAVLRSTGSAKCLQNSGSLLQQTERSTWKAERESWKQ